MIVLDCKTDLSIEALECDGIEGLDSLVSDSGAGGALDTITSFVIGNFNSLSSSFAVSSFEFFVCSIVIAGENAASTATESTINALSASVPLLLVGAIPLTYSQ